MFIGPYQILCRVSLVAYKITLPRNLSNFNSVFHVSQLSIWMTLHILSCLIKWSLKKIFLLRSLRWVLRIEAWNTCGAKRFPYSQGDLECNYKWRHLETKRADKGALSELIWRRLVSRTKLSFCGFYKKEELIPVWFVMP